MKLRVAQCIEKTEAEGPGERFAVWVQGCPIRCPGCCNPEMLSKDGGVEMGVAELAERVIATDGIEGLTLLGGEPFAQAGACASLAARVRAFGLTVMVFTGFTYQWDLDECDEDVRRLLAETDLLVDGPYKRKLSEEWRRWIGSTNQKMYCLTDAYSLEDPRFYERNTVEIRYRDGELVVNGWPAFEVKRDG